MNPNIEYSIRRVRPGGNRFGRRPGWRDKLLGIAFGAALLFGLWWLLLKPVSYSVMVGDVDGSFEWTDRSTSATHTKFTGFRKGNPVVVFISTYSNIEVIRGLAPQEQLRILLDYPEFPEPKRKQFANAIVVCAVSSDCSAVAHSIELAAKQRESEWKRR